MTMNHFRLAARLCGAALCAALLMASADAGIAPEESSCVQCHQNDIDDDNTAMVEQYLHGAHAKRGVTCADCHGGDPTLEDGDEAMSDEAGFRGAPARHEIPKFCSRCHSDPNYMRGYNPNLATDQYAKYLVSGHGQRLTRSKDSKVAVCTSCHGVHGILAADNPTSPTFKQNVPATCSECHADAEYMAGRDTPTDQLDEYTHSVHGMALLERDDRAAPSCADCHGNHEARIPDPSGVANTCAQCHNYIRDLFVSSPHKKVHEEHNYPECEVCHGNHAIERANDAMLSAGPESGGVCSECHDSGSKGMQAAITMRSAIDELRAHVDSTAVLISQADQIGLDVETVQFQLTQATTELNKSRSLIHTFDPKKVATITTEGLQLAGEVRTASEEILDEFSQRRFGFFASVIVILLLAGLLWSKIRQVDRREGIRTE